jgi:UDP-galactose transporter B1
MPSSQVAASVRLPLCVLGIWSCFFGYGILQEGIFAYRSAIGERFMHTGLLLFIEHGIAAAVSFIIICAFSQNSGLAYAPFIKTGAAVAGLQCLAKYASNESLKHVSYPVQALAKSSKTIPAIFGCFISGKHITPLQWLSAMGITGGTAGFSLVGKSTQAGLQASSLGIGLLCTSLVCDGCVASVLQSLRSGKASLTWAEIMFMTNFGAAIFMAPLAIFGNDASTGWTFVATEPGFMSRMFSFALCSAFGQVFIFLTIVWFGPDTNAKVTTIRKMATVLISIAWYGHSVHLSQWMMVCLAFGCVFAELFEQLSSGGKRPRKIEVDEKSERLKS